MKILLISDTHFDDKYCNEYRWGLFPWLKSTCIEQNISIIIICGDHLHNKDKHSSYLINRYIDNITDLLQVVDQILMIKGNHDLIEHSNPYLRWINNIPKIKFFIKPEVVIIQGKKFLFLPNALEPLKEWQAYINEINEADYIITHHTFNGAVSETGFKLSGISQSIFKDSKAKIWSGDIHKCQKLGRITYIGTQYPINFGDVGPFRSIILDLDSGIEKNLFYKTIRKHTLNISNPSELGGFKLKKGDQVKIKLSIEDSSNWENFKAELTSKCKELEVDLQQIEFIKKNYSLPLKAQETKLKNLTTQEIFEQYCEFSKVGEATKQFGLSILKGV